MEKNYERVKILKYKYYINIGKLVLTVYGTMVYSNVWWHFNVSVI